jgi:hypothetical protein
VYLFYNHTYYFSLKEYNYRRSKCKPKEEYTSFEKHRRLIFALNNIDNNFETTVFVDESSIWALRGGLYHHRKKSSYPKCNTIHPRNVKSTVFGVEYVGMDHCLVRYDFLRKIFHSKYA